MPTTKPVTIIAPQTPAMILSHSWPENSLLGAAAITLDHLGAAASIIKKHEAMIPQIRPALTEPRCSTGAWPASIRRISSLPRTFDAVFRAGELQRCGASAQQASFTPSLQDFSSATFALAGSFAVPEPFL